MIKKIIFSNYDDLKNPWYGGGGARAVHEVAKRLAAYHEVFVITGKYPGSKNEIIDRVQYLRIGVGVVGPFVGQAVYQMCLPWHAFTKNHDVWIESFTPPFSTAFLPGFTKNPVIGVTHMLAGKEMTKKYHLPFSMVERVGLQLYKRVITLTQFQKDQVLDANKKIEVQIIPNGLPEEIITRPLQREERHILFLGRIDILQKGLDVLLKSYSEISKKFPYPLVIAGNGPEHEQDKLKRLVEKLGLSEKVECVGRIEGEEKLKLLDHAVCTVMPSRTEGFPLVALEAMACGSPLVISDIPGLEWVPKNCSITARKLDSESFSEALAEVLQNGPLRNSLSKAAKEEVKAFSWDDIAAMYEKVISE